MKIEATTVSGQTVQFGTPIQMELCESFDTPASSLFAVFCVFSPIEEIEKIVVENDAEIVFVLVNLFCNTLFDKYLIKSNLHWC
ncbi:MAG: hypothetical protein EOM05_05620 [Clostridia bacterium]|nr:hypothetical protein [Clostridia bacterium]